MLHRSVARRCTWCCVEPCRRNATSAYGGLRLQNTAEIIVSFKLHRNGYTVTITWDDARGVRFRPAYTLLLVRPSISCHLRHVVLGSLLLRLVKLHSEVEKLKADLAELRVKHAREEEKDCGDGEAGMKAGMMGTTKETSEHPLGSDTRSRPTNCHWDRALGMLPSMYADDIWR
ncbi:uncharacterized protein C8Q71DRAFT_751678 [Rhodofomes roseus]|uniref:Uncharacterized protein n=1 Tax=Rhodofomes roseus TaxID=34475 RepID=A0ABQ8KLC8_9APHY|nr:uncharacterized protein C8Q71DRAFT_751678 [Rhodofomes roseus]KAH9838525.1 hypothetical protein C8Q71DRAFT_751678 [Rhodofomes roseus]